MNLIFKIICNVGIFHKYLKTIGRDCFMGTYIWGPIALAKKFKKKKYRSKYKFTEAAKMLTGF